MEFLIVIFVLAIIVFGLYVNFRIVARAGFNGWWSLLMLVPILNLILVWVFAFKPWPAVDGPSMQPSFQPPPGERNQGSDFQSPPPPPPPPNA